MSLCNICVLRLRNLKFVEDLVVLGWSFWILSISVSDVVMLGVFCLPAVAFVSLLA